MKIILSRKGFDSASGGYPSPILPDNRLISLPIPRPDDSNSYSDLKLNPKIEGLKSEINTYYDLMKELRCKDDKIICKRNWHELTKERKCHLDPDIRKEVLLERKDGWKGCFGQVNGAQTHLEDKVNVGDLFLFFGWFRKTKIDKDGKLTFDFAQENKSGLHVIFGYLQIGDIIKVKNTHRFEEWMKCHPHIRGKSLKKYQNKNTIYVACEKLSLNGLSALPGAGVFEFNDERVLTNTKLSEPTRSKWNLFPFSNKTKISYHPDPEKSWQKDYFQSASIGQEFVINAEGNAEDYEKVVEWAKEKIQSTKDYSN